MARQAKARSAKSWRASTRPTKANWSLMRRLQFGLAVPAMRWPPGIGIVHQELAFCENLHGGGKSLPRAVARAGHICFARRNVASGAANISAAIRKPKKIDPDDNLSARCPSANSNWLQIAAAVSHGAHFDFRRSRRAACRRSERAFFELIKQLQQKGVTAIYVSHRMEEIYRLCDAITVLRDGQHVETKPAAELDRDDLVKMMIGRSLEAYFPGHLDAQIGEELLRVENLSSPGKFENISFRLRAGEVLGFAGLVGAGPHGNSRGVVWTRSAGDGPCLREWQTHAPAPSIGSHESSYRDGPRGPASDTAWY